MQDRLDPGKENRTFETRLEFIANIFSHPLSKTEILASSVQFKLNKTYEIYLEEVNRSLSILASHDPTKVLSKIK
ncbi:MAG: hypothetical protein SOV25_00980 [Candidatus Onthovivens sp.]|nr:hypothetical protein [Candidatus Onthovivens sp.]